MAFADTVNNIPGINMLWSLLNPQQGYQAAQNELMKGWGEAKNYMLPYQMFGLNQIGQLGNAENALLNPEELQKRWIGGYEKSPYATQLQKEAMNTGQEAASSMGLMGSSAALNNLQTSATNIMNTDRQAYLNDLMNKMTKGIELGSNIYGTGATMGANLGKGAMETGENMGMAKYGQFAAPGEQLMRMIALAIQAMKAANGGGAATATA